MTQTTKKNPKPSPVVLPILVDEKMASQMLGVSASTLREFRVNRPGLGPKAVRIPKTALIRYRVRDLEAFAETLPEYDPKKAWYES